MQLFTFYILALVQFLSFIFANIALSKDTIRFIETTGRAVLENKQELDTPRRRALEDALYLAALHGGSENKWVFLSRYRYIYSRKFSGKARQPYTRFRYNF